MGSTKLKAAATASALALVQTKLAPVNPPMARYSSPPRATAGPGRLVVRTNTTCLNSTRNNPADTRLRIRRGRHDERDGLRLECACRRTSIQSPARCTHPIGKQWKVFTEALERPARVKPRLRKLLADPSFSKAAESVRRPFRWFTVHKKSPQECGDGSLRGCATGYFSG